MLVERSVVCASNQLQIALFTQHLFVHFNTTGWCNSAYDSRVVVQTVPAYAKNSFAADVKCQLNNIVNGLRNCCVTAMNIAIL